MQIKKVVAVFDEPNATSDAGALVLCAMDRRLGLIDRLTQVLADPRQPTR
ncbi:MAG: hypothetical protein ABIJ53_03725 [Verrucomicrobiota bacterium]